MLMIITTRDAFISMALVILGKRLYIQDYIIYYIVKANTFVVWLLLDALQRYSLKE